MKLMGASLSHNYVIQSRIIHTEEGRTKHQPSAKGTTISALSTKTVLVRCWETPTDSDSWNFTKHTRDVTGRGDSSGGNNLSSSMVPRNPNSIRICSDVVLGDTFVTCTTFVVQFMFSENSKNKYIYINNYLSISEVLLYKYSQLVAILVEGVL